MKTKLWNILIVLAFAFTSSCTITGGDDDDGNKNPPVVIDDDDDVNPPPDDDDDTIDLCENVDCSENGVCLPDSGECNCDTGYVGTNCEQIHPCVDVDCGAFGVCDEGTCYCNLGYDGDFCGQCAPGLVGFPDCHTPEGVLTVSTNLVGGAYSIYDIDSNIMASGSGNTPTEFIFNAGDYTIEFTDVAGYFTPTNIPVNLTDGLVENAEGTYVADLCYGADCGNGSCEPIDGSCSCDLGFAGIACDQCDASYFGYPNCIVDMCYGVTCDDGNVCNGAEGCDSFTGCTTGTPLTCDNGDVCDGNETCDAVAGCQTGIPLTCDNGDVCDGSETCDAVAGCQTGTPLTCDNGDVCDGAETCDSVAGCQVGTALTCDDSQACNGTETCDSVLGCQAGTSVDCNYGTCVDPVGTCNCDTGYFGSSCDSCDSGYNGYPSCATWMTGVGVLCDPIDILTDETSDCDATCDWSIATSGNCDDDCFWSAITGTVDVIGIYTPTPQSMTDTITCDISGDIGISEVTVHTFLSALTLYPNAVSIQPDAVTTMTVIATYSDGFTEPITCPSGDWVVGNTVATFGSANDLTADSFEKVGTIQCAILSAVGMVYSNEVTVTIDATQPADPVITTNGGGNFTVNQSDFTLEGSCASDTFTMKVQVDTDGWEVLDTYTAGDTTWIYNGYNDVVFTAHDYCFQALDEAGNISGSDCINIARMP